MKGGREREDASSVVDLMNAVASDPTAGIGKPEPLKYLGGVVWSRPNKADRLLCDVFDNRIEFFARSMPLRMIS